MIDETTPASQRRPDGHRKISERTLDAIQEAIDAGAFDNLPGKGKPLDLSDYANPFVPDEMRLAYHVLRNAGFSLPWIGERKDIERDRSAIERDVERKVAFFRVALDALETTPPYLRRSRRERLQTQRREWVTRLAVSIERLNQKIDNYNLSVPSTTLQTARVNGSKILDSLRWPES